MVDVIDQVPMGNNSPAVILENYPIFFKFLETVPSSEVQQVEEPVPVPPPPNIDEQVSPVNQQVEVPVPPPPDINEQDRPKRSLRRVNYKSLHEFGREGEDAWLPQLQTRQEGDKEDTLEEMEDRERRGAPE